MSSPRSSTAPRSWAPAPSAPACGAGPAITVIGVDVPSVDNSLNAVAPYARAKLNVRVHPEQDPKEAQQAVVEHLREQMPFGLALDGRAARDRARVRCPH